MFPFDDVIMAALEVLISQLTENSDDYLSLGYLDWVFGQGDLVEELVGSNGDHSRHVFDSVIRNAVNSAISVASDLMKIRFIPVDLKQRVDSI